MVGAYGTKVIQPVLRVEVVSLQIPELRLRLNPCPFFYVGFRETGLSTLESRDAESRYRTFGSPAPDNDSTGSNKLNSNTYKPSRVGIWHGQGRTIPVGQVGPENISAKSLIGQ